MTRLGKHALVADLLSSGIPVEVSVFGGSMLPTLWPGDRVTLAPARAQDLAVGDIAAISRAGSLVLHRVISVNPLLLQGDNCPTSDPPVGETEVRGKLRNMRPRFSFRRLAHSVKTALTS